MSTINATAPEAMIAPSARRISRPVLVALDRILEILEDLPSHDQIVVQNILPKMWKNCEIQSFPVSSITLQ
jgi:hypothetical protein